MTDTETPKPKMSWDYSTIDKDQLAKLPMAKLAPTYTLERGMGNACALDPPGYPTYFTRAVYTRYGNTPRKGASLVLLGHVVERAEWENGDTWENRQQQHQALMNRLYKPLPLEHPRVQEWMKALFGHFRSCYADDSQPERSSDHILIYPVPYYKLKSFHDDPRFSDEWREKEKASIAQANQDIEEAAQKIATPDNHMAVRYIRKVYPDFQPGDFLPDGLTVEQLLRNGPSSGAYHWYERLPYKPSPDECPGEAWGREGRHPVNRTWCQVCGWHQSEEAKADN